MKDSFHIDELVKVGEAYPWPERPNVGEAVQLNSGSYRMVIKDFVGEEVTCYSPNGDISFTSWRMLKPWMVS